MTYEKGVNTFKRIIQDSASEEEINLINNYIDELIQKMSDDVISYDEQNLLDNYINYLRDTVTNMDLVDRYDGVIFSKNSLARTEEELAKQKGNIKIKRLTDNHTGIVATSIVLETVIMLGLVIGILILALS